MTKGWLLVSCASGALLIAGAAVAQTPATGAAASAAGGGSEVTEIVVHAERREQSLQRVPVAVSVFTGNERDIIGIQSVQDVTNFAPGFTYDPQTVHAYLRGVGRQSFNVTDDARVAAYEDEFYVYSPYELDKSDLFLTQEQIERGPQNVGGKNADGGSIDMISVRPTDHNYAEIRLNGGNYGTYNFEGAISGPVAPGVNFRVAAYDHNQSQGIFNNVVDNRSEGYLIHEWYIEPQIEWKPNENTDLWVRGFIAGWANRGDAGSRSNFYTGDWDETNLNDANVAPLSANPNFGYAAIPGSRAQAGAQNPIANPFYGLPGQPAMVNYLPSSVTLYQPGIFNNPSASNPLTLGFYRPQTVELTEYDGVNGIFTYNFPGAPVELKYITGYQQYDYTLKEPLYDTDVQSFTMPLLDSQVPGATPLQVNTFGTITYIEDDEWWSHELLFQSTGDSPLQWTAGVFYYHQHYIQPITEDLPYQPQVAAPVWAGSTIGGVTAGETLPNPNNLIVDEAYNFTYQDAAGYGQMSYKFNDQFKVTGDLRYTWDDKYGSEQSRYVYFGQGVIDGYGPYYGNYTPALDITQSVVCLSGVASNCNSPSSGLGRGVVSMGTVGPSGFATRQLGGTSSALTGGFEAQWTPTSSILAYARYDRGYQAMSFNAGVTGPVPETLPEFLNSYQVGYKQSFGNKLLLDIDAYYYDFINQQVPLTVVSAGVVEPIFYNVPSSTSAGVEVEAYWTPTRNWNITFTYSFDYTAINTGCSGTVTGGVLLPTANSLCVEDTNDPAAVAPGAKPYPGQDFAVSPVLQSVKGNPLPDAPEHKLGVDVAYTWHLQPGTFTVSGAVVYRSTQAGTMFDRSYDNAPGWYGINLRAIWKAPGDKYEIIAYVNNVTNTLQYIVGEGGLGLTGNASHVFNPATGLYEINNFEIAPPRNYGIEVRYRFY